MSDSALPNGIDLAYMFGEFAAMGPSKDKPIALAAFAKEIVLSKESVFAILCALEDAGLVDASGRGLESDWWIVSGDVSPDNAESFARDVLGAKAIAPDASKTPAPAKRKAQRSRPVVTPSKAPTVADSTPVTVPVDWNDPSKGRRELDPSKGERVISESVFKAVSPVPASDKGLATETGEKGETLYESAIVKNNLALDTPDTIPPCPDGVSVNFWYMAHAAITQTARDSWMRRCLAQSEAHKAETA